jgi:hypothetical protein
MTFGRHLESVVIEIAPRTLFPRRVTALGHPH